MNEQDQDRLELLDRIAKRAPEIDLSQHATKWDQLPDGAQALFIDGAAGYFAIAGEDLHAYGSLDPIVPGWIGCIVIKPDGSRYVAQAMPDPLAPQSD
jgi:hypothetical protein